MTLSVTITKDQSPFGVVITRRDKATGHSDKPTVLGPGESTEISMWDSNLIQIMEEGSNKEPLVSLKAALEATYLDSSQLGPMPDDLFEDLKQVVLAGDKEAMEAAFKIAIEVACLVVRENLKALSK